MLAELARWRAVAPDRIALATRTPTGVQCVTWAQLHEAARAVATGARALVGRGPVVVLVDASAGAVAAIIGLTAAGVDVVLIEAESSYLADEGGVLQRFEVSTVVGPAVAAADLPAFYRFVSYEQIRTGTGRARVGAPGDILQLTSGSTGEPRVARQPTRNILHGAHTYQRIFELTEADTILAAVPLAHSFGLVAGLGAALVSGARLSTLDHFGIRRLRDGLAEGATLLLGTPLIYQLLLPTLREARDYPRLRTVLSSGGPLPAALAARVRAALGLPVRQIYGSTEAGLIAYQPDTGDPWPPDAVGVLAPGVLLRVEQRADGGEGGHLFVRSPSVFAGYLDAPGPHLDAEGFYDTGDLATVDDQGRVFLTGRKDTFINVGGRKVNPRRVERIVAGCAGVREVYVFGDGGSAGGGPDGDGGGDDEQRVHAAVVLAPQTTAADVIAHCRAFGLRPYETPHRVHVLDALPRTGMGKVDRRRVIEATTQVAAATKAESEG